MANKEITLEEISTVVIQFSLIRTKLVIMNQKIANITKDFEKLYFKELKDLDDNLAILRRRKGL